MTREKAIKVLEMFLYKQCDLERTKFAYDQLTVWDAVKMASEALEGIEPEAIKDCRNCKHGKYNDYLNVLFCNCHGDCKDWEKWESKEPRRGKGHWIMKWHNFFQREMPTCSECGTGSVFKTKFCHECGADMRGEENGSID